MSVTNFNVGQYKFGSAVNIGNVVFVSFTSVSSWGAWWNNLRWTLAVLVTVVVSSLVLPTPVIEVVIIRAVSSSPVGVLISCLHSWMRVQLETPIDSVRVASIVGASLVGAIVLLLAAFCFGMTVLVTIVTMFLHTCLPPLPLEWIEVCQRRFNRLLFGELLVLVVNDCIFDFLISDIGIDKRGYCRRISGVGTWSSDWNMVIKLRYTI